MYSFLIKVTVLADMVSMSAMARPPHPLQVADVIKMMRPAKKLNSGKF
jgi:hypothetical protein